MRKILTIFFFFLGIGKIFSQCQGNYWLIGDSISLKFDCVTNQPTVGEFQIWHDSENYSCIADSVGNLLFYLNGSDSVSVVGNTAGIVNDYSTLYNKNGERFINGDSINTSYSATNGSIIIPNPNNPNQYYIFYIQNNQIPGFNNGLSYSLIDMNQNGGLGSIVLKNQYLLNGQSLSEKVSAVKHGNGRDWWILTHDLGNTFYEFLITPYNISTPITYHLSPFFTPDSSILSLSVGEMLFNQVGNKILLTINANQNGMFAYDFDRCNGIISSPKHYGQNTETMYGCSFSPDGSKVYSSSFSKIYQFDINDTASYNILWADSCMYCACGQHQIGADNKIYITTHYFTFDYGPGLLDSSNMSLSVINNPDSPGVGCQFTHLSLYLNGHRTKLGLPNMPNYNLSALDESECDSLGLGVKEIKRSNELINIYPNPASDELTINSEQLSVSTIEITDLLGRAVMRLPRIEYNARNDIKIDVSNLLQGVYFVKVQMNDGSVTVKKFVKE